MNRRFPTRLTRLARLARMSAPGLVLVLGGCGTDVSGPSATLLSCVFADPSPLQVGGVLQVRGEDGRSVCLSPDVTGDYLYIPFFAAPGAGPDDPAVTLGVEVTGGGFLTPSSLAGGNMAPAPIARTEGVRLDDAFHRQLRERERRELEPLLRHAAAAPPGAGPAALEGSARAVAVPAVGDLLEFNVAISCTDVDMRTGRVEYVSEHAVVVADTSNPTDLPTSDYAYFGITFDTLVYPMGSEHFGVPSDIDENGRSIIFFTRAVNELTAHDAATVIAGFFWSGDLFPETDTPQAQACPAANQAEMFYVRSADPLGQFGPPLDIDDIRTLSVPVIGHEYQHLINAARRLWVNSATTFEAPWLNEGLSHIAEELLFYRASHLEPRLDLTADDIRAVENGVWAYNQYMAPNVGNFSRYLARPDTASLMGIDNLVTRGAAWSFLRYAADRSGRSDEAFFFDVVNSTRAGLETLDGVLGESALGWMQDWTVSVYADDLVPDLDPRYSQPSWNLRDIFVNRVPGQTGQYPLEVRRLDSGADVTLDLLAGGAAFLLFSVDGGSRAAVHVEAEGGAPPSSLRGSFLRAR